MRNYFTLAGVDSRDFGIYISGAGTYSAPARRYDLIQIPGRNGDLIGTETAFENGTYTYQGAFIFKDLETNLAAFRAFLMSLFGYQRLVDTYHPGEYREVIIPGAFEPAVTAKCDAGQFDIEFSCKPQRFLTSGENVTTLTADGSITNPTLFPSRPLLRVYGAGVLGINSESITISQADEYTDIDCEMQDAFKGTANKNPFVQLSGYNFPTFRAGVNNISLGSGITQVDITPRWWTV